MKAFPVGKVEGYHAIFNILKVKQPLTQTKKKEVSLYNFLL